MKLRDQIESIATRRVNGHGYFSESTQFPLLVTLLASKAFIEEWPAGPDSRAVRRAAQLLVSPGWVSPEEEGVE